jgi:cytoskeleton protein RodZ
VDVSVVEALEANDFDALSGPVFVKGYIRNYGRLLNIDYQSLIDSFDHSSAARTPPITPISNLMSSGGSQPRLPLDKILMGVIVVVGLLVAWWVGKGIYDLWQDKGELPTVALPRDSRGELVVPQGPLQPGLPEQEQAVSPAVRETVPPVAEPQPETPVDDTAQPEAVEEAESAPADNRPTARLTVYFSEDSWTEVYDATEQRLVSRVGKAGDSRTVEGVPPFRVVLGYAPGVNLEYNGKPIDISGQGRGQVARFKVGEDGIE